MGNSSCKEESEKEINHLLSKIFSKAKIQSDPKIDSKKADFLINPNKIYIEVYSVKDVVSDIKKETPFSQGPHVNMIDIPKDNLLDRLRGKILEESEQLPEKEKNLLVIKIEDYLVKIDDIVEVFVDPQLLLDKISKKTQVVYSTHFRTREEQTEVFQKISGIIVYEKVCRNGKLQGVYINNKKVEVPLDKEESDMFIEMICNKCN